jgi:hypothetical protein
MARRTYDGSSDAEVHADPLLTATSLMASMSASPSTWAKLRFRLPGRRRSRLPFTVTRSSPARMARRSRSRSARMRGASAGISWRASAAALPNPTMPGTLSVPER